VADPSAYSVDPTEAAVADSTLGIDPTVDPAAAMSP
jgi:hypothetical protein